MNYSKNMNQKISINSEGLSRCNYCGQITDTVRVHGHEQCTQCGINVEPCCDNEKAREETW